MLMPKQTRVEKGEATPQYWDRMVRDAFKNDPLRIIIELIKNSADSYTRLHKNNVRKPPFEIVIKLSCKPRAPPAIEIIDYANSL